MQKIDETAVIGVLLQVRLLLGDQEAGKGVALADRRIGFDHLARETRDLKVVEESVDERCSSGVGKLNRSLRTEVESVQNLFDKTQIVLWDDAAGIAGLVP